MILPDVNVLVYAFDADSDQHETYRAWLLELVAGQELGLCPEVLVGFVRVVTNRRIFTTPASTREAVGFASALVTAPKARWVVPEDRAWQRLVDTIDADRHVTGNLVPDAWLAALSVANGCRLATADRGFARFAGLDWFDPAASNV